MKSFADKSVFRGGSHTGSKACNLKASKALDSKRAVVLDLKSVTQKRFVGVL
jgi:hypothetical protein